MNKTPTTKSADHAATGKEIADLRDTLESLYYVVGDALGAIGTLASLAQRECDRGEGKLSGHLVISALYDIVYRAEYARSHLESDFEALGLGDCSAAVRRVVRGSALEAAFRQGGAA